MKPPNISDVVVVVVAAAAAVAVLVVVVLLSALASLAFHSFIQHPRELDCHPWRFPALRMMDWVDADVSDIMEQRPD